MTDTLAGEARRHVFLFSANEEKPKMHFEKRSATADKPAADVLVVEDVPVFRSGHFYDSMGFEHNWEDIHIDQMVANFNLLQARGIFVDVPVRKGHPSFIGNRMDDLIGYHTTGLKSEKRKNPVDGVEYLYLLATYEILDPDAQAKISSGLWRNLSSEVGGWLSNSATEFWPVYQGVAYVDIPAVEGLKGFNSHNGVGTSFSIMSDNEEAPMTGDAAPGNNGQAAAGSTVTNAKDAGSTSFQTSDPAAFARSQFCFTIGGQQTQDFSAVQAHITSLETAQDEAREQHRKDFIKGLAEGPTPKIMAGQIEGIESYALAMSPDAWKAFEESWGKAASVPAVSNHGSGASNTDGTSPAGSKPDVTPADEFAAIVKQHRLSGMKQPEIEKTASFGKLKAVDPNHPALSA